MMQITFTVTTNLEIHRASHSCQVTIRSSSDSATKAVRPSFHRLNDKRNRTLIMSMVDGISIFKAAHINAVRLP